MDVQMLPAPVPARQAHRELDTPSISSLRVRDIFPPHAGCSHEAVLTIEALDPDGSPVSAYLHIPNDLLDDLARYVGSWAR